MPLLTPKYLVIGLPLVSYDISGYGFGGGKSLLCAEAGLNEKSDTLKDCNGAEIIR